MLTRYRWLAANAVLAVSLLGSIWGRQSESAAGPAPDCLKRLELPFRHWKATDTPISDSELNILQPDAVLARDYVSPDKESVQLVVIAGHRKRTVHTPGYCMVGGGWDVVSQHQVSIPLPAGDVPAVRSVMMREGSQMIATYFFTDGDFSTSSVVKLQWRNLTKRMRARLPLGALVRIIVPVTRDRQSSERLSDDFAKAALPAVLAALHDAGNGAR